MRKHYLKEIKNLNSKLEKKKLLYENKEMGNTYNLLINTQNILNKFGNELSDEKLNDLEKDLNMMISNNNQINKIFSTFNDQEMKEIEQELLEIEKELIIEEKLKKYK